MPAARRQKWHACAQPSCPNLVSASEPCPEHGRPKNHPWSKNRSPGLRAAQHKLRQAALARSSYTCERCGHHDPTGKNLQVHHMRAADDFDLAHAKLVCKPCHQAIDVHARG